MISTQIGFERNPVDFKNDINQIVLKSFRNEIQDGIKQAREMIQFHLEHSWNKHNSFDVKEDKFKLTFK